MMMAAIAGPVLEFLATYLVHSTLLFGCAWLLGAFVVQSDAWRETLWKAALVGGILTTAAAQASPWTSVRVALPYEGNAAEVAQAPGALSDASTEVRRDEVATDAVNAAPPQGGSEVAAPAQIPVTPAIAEGNREGEDVGRALSWPLLVLGAWFAITLLLAGRLAWRRARLARLLRSRTPVTQGGLPEMLAELRRSAGVWVPVRLTSTAATASPLVLGSREICVPERFVTELGPEEQRAALAHELAHLARRDPAWLLGAMLLECVFFFQPLQRIARRGLRESAEYLADSWAVRLAGGRLHLARCLAEVAAWVSTSDEPAFAEMAAMAEGGSPLLNRVSRLLEREPAEEPRRALRVATALVMITAAWAFAPAIGGSRPAVALQDFIDVTFWPERGELTDGLRWADASARAAGASTYWAAWAVDSRVPVGSSESTDTESIEWLGMQGPYVADVLGVEHELSGDAHEPAIMLVQFGGTGSDARIERVAMRSGPVAMELRGRVYWLGEQDAAGSMTWFARLYDQNDAPRMREAAVEAISVHDVADAPRFLRRVIESRNAGRSLREEAVEGLAWHPTDENLSALVTLARDEADMVLGAEAAETLGEMDHPGVREALRSLTRAGDAYVRQEALETLSERGDTALAALLLDIALNDPDSEMRSEAVELMQELPTAVAVPLLRRVIDESSDREAVHQAVETLAEIGTAEAFVIIEQAIGHENAAVRREAMEVLAEERGTYRNPDALLQAALHDDDPDIRREAVEYMAELPAQQAVDLLRRVAFESGDGTAERQAAESLGEVGTPEALAVLDDIIARNPSEDASFQAVESIAQNFARELAEPRLIRIVREHPSRRVRREALDQLSELNGGP